MRRIGDLDFLGECRSARDRLQAAHDLYKLLPFQRDVNPKERQMFNFVEMVLAGIGAGMILVALTFVSALIGVLVNAMIALFAGPVIDQVLARKAASLTLGCCRVYDPAPPGILSFPCSYVYSNPRPAGGNFL